MFVQKEVLFWVACPKAPWSNDWRDPPRIAFNLRNTSVTQKEQHGVAASSGVNHLSFLPESLSGSSGCSRPNLMFCPRAFAISNNRIGRRIRLDSTSMLDCWFALMATQGSILVLFGCGYPSWRLWSRILHDLQLGPINSSSTLPMKIEWIRIFHKGPNMSCFFPLLMSKAKILSLMDG